jgi:uncharacterized protein YjbI with pentapeptide repeats
MKFLFLIPIISLLLGNQVFGFKQEDLDKFIKTGRCDNCDLSGADLSGVTTKSGLMFQNTNLSGANFSGATIKYTTQFRNTNFSGANFSGATIQPGSSFIDTNLSGANFSEATLEMVTISNLTTPTKLDLSNAKECKYVSILINPTGKKVMSYGQPVNGCENLEVIK